MKQLIGDSSYLRSLKAESFTDGKFGVPTVREEDGLALSSRNRFLSPDERRTALALSRALFAGRDRPAAQEALRARALEVPATQARAEALAHAVQVFQALGGGWPRDALGAETQKTN